MPEPIVMRLLAGVVLASIFLGIFLGLYSAFRTGGEEADFRRDAGNLATMIRSMSLLIPGRFGPLTSWCQTVAN